jgi:TPP-dependent pyruvate/acetoin dehydrogenase alpha subunit
VGLELATESEVKDIELKVRKEVEAAVAIAKAASPPPKEELTRDIYTGTYAPPRMCNL